MPTVAILAFPNMQSLDITGPMDVFAEANRFLEPARHYKISVLGTGPDPMRCSNGLTVQADCCYAGCVEVFDLLVVPGGPTLPSLPRDANLSCWLQKAARRFRRVASVCNGAFLLAHAGLLDGLRATTHWNDASKLAARFPEVDVDVDRIFLRQGNIYTSAGVTAGIDLALHLVFEDHGSEVSQHVARRLLVFSQRNGGQSQFSPYLTTYTANASVVDTVREHIKRNIDHDFTVERLANLTAMSVRNFARVFVREAGVTPAEFVERCRIDAARILLDTETQPLKTIAHRCGFGTATRMRMAFTRHIGVTAQQYRQNFGVFATDPRASGSNTSDLRRHE